MFTPVYLYIDYHSSFPWWSGAVLQIAGLAFLWLTRFSAREYPRIGGYYYLLCSMIRPAGIVLIGWGWLEICAAQPPSVIPWSPLPTLLLAQLVIWIIVLIDPLLRRIGVCILPLYILVLVGFGPLYRSYFYLTVMVIISSSMIYSGWAIAELGLRQSFLFADIHDPLVVTGPYRFHRHPQLLAAFVAAYATLWLNPSYPNEDSIARVIALLHSGATGPGSLYFQDCTALFYKIGNLTILALGIFLITRSEEKDLTKRLDKAYLKYREITPAFWCIGKRQGLPSWGKCILFTLLSFMVAIVMLMRSGCLN